MTQNTRLLSMRRQLPEPRDQRRVFDGLHSSRTIHALMHWIASTPHSVAIKREGRYQFMGIVGTRWVVVAEVIAEIWDYAIEHKWVIPRNVRTDGRFYRLTRNAQRAGRQQGYTFREHRF